MNMNFPEIYSATGMMELIQKIGFLPLLDSGIEGFSAEDIVAERFANAIAHLRNLI